ncbi:efflux RND transporter periplasmic adaptor subunit [Inediibacterium massiliense]|uniref:efflux RND transporter periplasmic adaptor subunit n=1 Tax=Inediibacterium massiliense TaxID=1658111 RepID=UPI0006B49AB7|nr:efflux RND transporter periplasmic adaptor subunit [Inediibacterium massiliense]
MKRKIAILLTFLLSIQLILTGCGKKEEKVKANSLKPVSVEDVNEQSYSEEIDLSGNIKPSQTVKIAYKIPGGVVSNIFVEEGDVVKKNDVLIKLDAYDYTLNVDATNAKLESSRMKMDSQVPSKIEQAKAALDLIEKNYERMKNLYEEGAISTAQLDEIQTKYIAAKNTYQEALDAKVYTKIELEQAKAAKDKAQSDLSDTTLTSPIDGIVLKKIAEVGETVGQGYPVMVLGNLNQVEMEIGVADASINKIVKGQKAKVYVYGVEKEFEGVVSEVGAVADEKTRTFPVKIIIDNKDHKLKPGMMGKVRIPLDKKKAVLVPVDAVLNTPQGAAVFVYDSEKKKVSKRKVVPGDIIHDKIEIKEGLKLGEKIVIEGQLKLKNDEAVHVEEMK